MSSVHIVQFEIYAALFCLEHKIDPSDIELREEDITPIMDKIVRINKLLEKIDYEES